VSSGAVVEFHVHRAKTISQLGNWPSSAGGAIFHRPVGRKIEPVHIICQFVLGGREKESGALLILSLSRLVGQKWLVPHQTLLGFFAGADV
jgi:hypothetical protein